MSLIIQSYVIYLTLSICLTVWVATTLFKKGMAFLVEVFQNDQDLADSINHLLLVGFYLVNLGFIALFLKQDMEVISVKAVFETLSMKLGTVMLVLGSMHFFNLAALTHARQNALKQKAQREYWLQNPTRPPVR